MEGDELERLEFKDVIRKFIEKMGFEVDSSSTLRDGSVEFSARTSNPMGGDVHSLIRAIIWNSESEYRIKKDLPSPIFLW